MNRLALALSLIACTFSALADCETNATIGQIEQSRQKMLDDPNRFDRTEAADVEVISIRNDDESIVIGNFTQERHPAHPAFVISAIYEHEGKVWVYHQGFTAGDCEVFQTWLEAFGERDRELQRMYEQHGS